MGYDDEPADWESQLAEERQKRETAEQRVAELEAQRAGAAERSPTATAGAGAVAAPNGPDPALLARLQDRSVPWETLQQEMAAAGFGGAGPQPSQRGMRKL